MNGTKCSLVINVHVLFRVVQVKKDTSSVSAFAKWPLKVSLQQHTPETVHTHSDRLLIVEVQVGTVDQTTLRHTEEWPSLQCILSYHWKIYVHNDTDDWGGQLCSSQEGAFEDTEHREKPASLAVYILKARIGLCMHLCRLFTCLYESLIKMIAKHGMSWVWQLFGHTVTKVVHGQSYWAGCWHSLRSEGITKPGLSAQDCMTIHLSCKVG